MVTDVCEATPLCVILKVADVLPAGTTTVAGAAAADLLELDKEMVAPPVGAGPERVTVPVTAVVDFPFTVLGVIDRLTNEVGWTVSAPCCVLTA